jgi:hypothetical protein
MLFIRGTFVECEFWSMALETPGFHLPGRNGDATNPIGMIGLVEHVATRREILKITGAQFPVVYPDFTHIDACISIKPPFDFFQAAAVVDD